MKNEIKIDWTLWLWTAVLGLIMTFCAAVATAQTCVPPLYQGNVNATGNCGSLTVRWLNRNQVKDIDHYTVRWLTDGVTNTQPGNAVGDTRHDLYCQFSSHVVITQYLKNGASCSTMSTGTAPHTPACGLCGGNGGGALGVANGASWGPFQTENSIAVLGTESDMVGGTAQAGATLPFSLLGLKVTVAGQPAGLFYVSPRQVNFWIPYDVPLGIQSVRVTTADGRQFNGSANIQVETPAIFTETANGQGYGKATWYGNGYMSLWGTGIRSPWVSLYLGDGRRVEATYSGPAPGFYGLWQLNFPINRPASPLGAFVRSWVNECRCIEGGGFRDSNGFDLH